MLRILRPTLKPPLQQIRFKQAVEKVVAETREKFSFLHQNLSMLRVLITDPRQTCFAASDVSPVSGMTLAQFYPIRSQYLRNLQH